MRALGDTAAAGLALGAALLVFFWTPLTTSGGYYAGVDILQYFPVFAVPPGGYSVKNNFIGDTVLVFFPAFRLTIEELWAGRLPLWNPYNGWGVPHLAGYQSGVFSPFSVPYYVLPFRAALIVAPFAKLFVFGLLTHLFLRRIGCRAAAALVGAMAFTFSGYNVLWLHYPLSSSVIVLPAGFYCAELVLQARDRRGRGVALLLFTVALAAGLMAGHPETYFYGSLLLGAWLAYRCAGHRENRRTGFLRFGQFAACGLAAIALCAVQLLPFFEYLRDSTTLASRHDLPLWVMTPLRIPLQFFPNLLGTVNPYANLFHLVGLNYIESNTGYIGLTALFLGLWAVATVFQHRSSHVVFFAAAAVTWLAYAYDVLGFGRLISVVPPLSLTIPHRSLHFWLFSIACLAGLGVEQLLGGRAVSSARLAVSTLAGAAAALVAAIASAIWLYDRTSTQVTTPFALHTPLRAAFHVGLVSGSFVIGIAGLAFLAAPWGRDARRDRVAVGMLIFSIFLQGGWLFRNFNPTVGASYFYPLTAPLRRLIDAAADRPTLFVGDARVPANTNAWYHVRSVWHYDGIGVRRGDALRGRLLGPEVGEGAVKSVRVLQLLGIGQVATTSSVAFGGRLPELAHDWTDGRIHLFRVPDALPRFFGVAEARAVASDEVALASMEAGDFDPRQTVLVHDTAVEAGDASEHRGSGSLVQVIEETPTRIRLRAHRVRPGWVVALQTYMPGWTATVNGNAVGVSRANFHFTAIPVGAGENDVVLRYEPRSVRIGGAVSMATMIVLALAALALAFTRRRPREAIAVP